MKSINICRSHWRIIKVRSKFLNQNFYYSSTNNSLRTTSCSEIIFCRNFFVVNKTYKEKDNYHFTKDGN